MAIDIKMDRLIRSEIVALGGYVASKSPDTLEGKVDVPVEEIIKAAQDTEANLIAMSTHGASGLKRWAMGSVADKVLHHSEIPVLIVRVYHEKLKS